MSWYAKVNWSEGLFLRPHHLQQADRYVENALDARTRLATPYPWGFSLLEVDRDLAQQSKFALRRGAGIMADGTLFEFPADSPSPAAIDVPEPRRSTRARSAMTRPTMRRVSSPHRKP